jgi:hypothetical protein
MSTISVHSPIKVAVPRAALWAAAAFARLAGWVEGNRLAQAEQRRAQQRADEAAAVREYARRFASHDPRFAADLLVAADRHEATL